jgi:hypothetical protein
MTPALVLTPHTSRLWDYAFSASWLDPTIDPSSRRLLTRKCAEFPTVGFSPGPSCAIINGAGVLCPACQTVLAALFDISHSSGTGNPLETTPWASRGGSRLIQVNQGLAEFPGWTSADDFTLSNSLRFRTGLGEFYPEVPAISTCARSRSWRVTTPWIAPARSVTTTN